jgi:hypothetical protein
MAPHGKQMTPEEKQIIVALSQQGYSSYKIAEITGKNRRTICKFLRTRRVRGSKRLRTVLEEMLVTNWRLNWSVISPKLCLLSERSIRYIIMSPRTPVFLPLPLRGKFSSDSRTRRLLRNFLIVLLFKYVLFTFD